MFFLPYAWFAFKPYVLNCSFLLLPNKHSFLEKKSKPNQTKTSTKCDIALWDPKLCVCVCVQATQEA